MQQNWRPKTELLGVSPCLETADQMLNKIIQNVIMNNWRIFTSHISDYINLMYGMCFTYREVATNTEQPHHANANINSNFSIRISNRLGFIHFFLFRFFFISIQIVRSFSLDGSSIHRKFITWFFFHITQRVAFIN